MAFTLDISISWQYILISHRCLLGLFVTADEGSRQQETSCLDIGSRKIQNMSHAIPISMLCMCRGRSTCYTFDHSRMHTVFLYSTWCRSMFVGVATSASFNPSRFGFLLGLCSTWGLAERHDESAYSNKSPYRGRCSPPLHAFSAPRALPWTEKGALGDVHVPLQQTSKKGGSRNQTKLKEIHAIYEKSVRIYKKWMQFIRNSKNL